MSNLTTKQKIIVGIVISVIIVIIGICGYSMIGQQDNWEQDGLLEEENWKETIGNQENNIMLGEEGNAITDKETNSKIEETDYLNTLSEDYFKKNGYENLEGKIVIHITGAVQKTGILVLKEGARIADAIDAAGGNTESADLDEVNLAYILEDGQKIYIPKKEDKVKLEKKVHITSGSGNNVIVQTINTDTKSENGGNRKVNINTALQSELENLPGIGPSTASKIIEYRKQNGNFNKIEDLQNVKGIGDAKFGKIKEQIVVK